MKHNLVHEYRLEKRLLKLESLVLERSVGRGGGPSKAYQIWDYLMNNGPKSVADLKSALPKEVTNFINFYADNNLLNKNGDMISANADYAWDDVGVIPRTAQQELMNSIRTGELDNIPEAPIEEPAQSRPTRAPRQRAIKQNLFSRKFDEVKAAVDAGQDVNQRNDKGHTPLTFAANSKNGGNADIIEYLIEHGARQATFKGNSVFDLVCKNRNDDAIKVILKHDSNNTITRPSMTFRSVYDGLPQDAEIYDLAAQKERVLDSYVHSFYFVAYKRSILSKEKYEELISTIINNTDEEHFYGYNYRTLKSELEAGILATVDSLAKHFKYLAVEFRNFETLAISKDTATKLVEYYKEAAAGKLEISCSVAEFIDTCKDICKTAKVSSDFLDDMLTPGFISNLSQSAKTELLGDALHTKNADLIDKLAKAKVKLDAKQIISDIRFNKDFTRSLIKLIDKSTLSDCGYYEFQNIIESRNEYLIEYIIDAGLGEALAANCIHVHPNRQDGADLCLKLCKENGIDIADNASEIENRMRSERDYNQRVREIINNIKEDTWDQYINRYVEEHPEILSDEKVLNAIRDNNTATSRQLQRRIERLPKPDKDTYDM